MKSAQMLPDIEVLMAPAMPSKSGGARFEVAKTVQSIADGAKHEQVVLVDARSDIRRESLSQMIEWAESHQHEGFCYTPTEGIEGQSDLAELSVESFPTSVTALERSPMCIALTTRTAIRRAAARKAQSLAAFTLDLLADAVMNSESIVSTPFTVRSTDANTLPFPSTQEVAACLRAVVDNTAIEELFPAHPWSAHQQESAAASYHTLAATFLKLGDIDAAQECVRISDGLEDSPRSLALKGLIAIERGETLGAVANMVSSLTQYEQRKKNDGSHYLHFTPKNVEVVHTNLNAGLSALNKQDNARALEHFAQAVFQFDGFYADHGLRMKDMQ